MTRSRKRKLQRLTSNWASVPLAAAAFAQGGVAQAQQTTAAVEAAPVVGLEEVIVTAQKRVEDVQKVPISIQVLNGEQLEQLGVNNFVDYAKYMPSMSFQTVGPGQSQVYFRGISTGYSNLHAGYLPSVGTYIDETPVTTISGVLDVHMYDIQRVEGLAGPQGTLFGASSLAGTIRVLTNKPDPSKFDAGIDATAKAVWNGGPGGTLEGFVNLPAGDRAAIRLVGYYDKQGGYIDNVPQSTTYQRPAGGTFNFAPTSDRPWLWTVAYDSVTGDYTNEFLNPHPGTFNNAGVVETKQNYTENYGGRAAIKLEVSDDWTIMPSVMYQNQKAHGDFAFDPKKGDLKVADMRPVYNNDSWTLSAMTITGKLSNVDVVYAGSWLNRHVDNEYDYAEYSVAYDYCFHICYTYLPETGHQNEGPYVDGQGGPNLNKFDLNPQLIDPTQYVQNHDNYTKNSQELRFSTSPEYATRLIAGIFYQRQTDAIRAEFREDGLSAYWSVPRNPGIAYLSDQQRTDTDSAAFLDITQKWTDKFSMSAGIRGYNVNNTLYGFFGYNSNWPSSSGEHICFQDAPAGATRPCVNTSSQLKESGETHRINATYEFEPGRMVYATYSTGFRPGGNNRRPQAKTWQSDTITNYEVGWKTQWFANTLRLNGALFYEKWNGAQVAIQGENGITSIVNAGDARTQGVELQIDWLAMNNLNLSLSGTYVSAETTTTFCEPTALGVPVTGCTGKAVAAPSGTKLPGVPDVKLNASARYHFNVNDFQSFVQLAGVYTGTTTYDLQAGHNSRVGETPAYGSLDFTVGTAQNHWTLEGYIYNLTDERGELARTSECAAHYCLNNYRVVPIMPRNFGIKYGYRF